MQGKSSMQKDMEVSEEAWRQQFDPTSEHYHGGSKQEVPIGGDRVPQTMLAMYPQGFDPNQPQEVIDYGEGYKQVEQERAIYTSLKKSLAKLCPVIEAFLRHEEIFKDKGDVNNEKHVKTHEDNLKKQQANLEAVQKELEDYLPKLDKAEGDGPQIIKELKKAIQDSNKKYTTKETLTDFNFQVKKLSTKVFAEAQKCLQRLKDIKKSHAKKLEAEKAQKTEDKPKQQVQAPKQEK